MIATYVKKYIPAGLMNYSNSRVRGYGLLVDLYLIISNSNGYSKNLKISVSALDFFLVGKSRRDPWWCIDVVFKIRWTRVRLSS